MQVNLMFGLLVIASLVAVCLALPLNEQVRGNCREIIKKYGRNKPVGVVLFDLSYEKGTKRNFVSFVSFDKKLTCQQITGYFIGTFQDPKNKSAVFTAQFQINVEINLDDRRMYLLRKWNNAYSGDDLEFAIDDGDHGKICGPKHGDNCSIKFTGKKSKRLLIQMKKYLAPENFIPRVINIESPDFNNSITLQSPILKCSKTLKNNNPWNLEQSLYQQCFCCGDYKPDPQLGCPTSPWA